MEALGYASVRGDLLRLGDMAPNRSRMHKTTAVLERVFDQALSSSRYFHALHALSVVSPKSRLSCTANPLSSRDASVARHLPDRCCSWICITSEQRVSLGVYLDYLIA